MKWSWNRVHLDLGTLGDRATLERFLGWLNKRVSSLSQPTSLNKNQLQELLLGIGLLIRDIELSLYPYAGTVPDGIEGSCLLPQDVNPLFKVMKLLSAAINYGMRYAFCKVNY